MGDFELEPGASIEIDVDGYISRKGWAVQKVERQREIVLRVCPLCQKESKRSSDRNFYINRETGLWSTYCCDKKGNLLTLKKQMGDLDLIQPAFAGFGTSEAARMTAKLKGARGRTWGDDASLPPPGLAEQYHNRLLNGEVPEAFEYLQAVRSLTEETIRHFGIGVALRGYCGTCSAIADVQDGKCPTCKGEMGTTFERITIPYKVDGQVVNIKYRSIPPDDKRYERWTGAPTTLFNVDSIDGEFKRAVITEGEIDAITAHQLGYSAVVSPGSAQKNIEDEWVEQLALIDDLLLAYDCDDAGEKGAKQAAELLGKYRCRRVKLPLKDVNDCLRSGLSEAEIRACFEGAASYKVSQVKHVSQFADDLRALKKQGGRVYGRQTKWRGLNAILGGMRDGEITVVTGDTGSGKTTWSTALGLDMAEGDINTGRNGVGVLVASFEMPIVEVARKLATMDSGIGFVDMTDQELEDSITNISGLDFYFVDQYGQIDLSDLRDAIEYGVRRYKLWLVILDHLHFFLNCKPEEERFAIDHTMRQLKLWALKLGIHLVLVVHPAKLRIVNGVEAKVDLNDLKGSSEIKKTADNVIRVWVPRGEQRGGMKQLWSEITTLKVRSDFGREDATILTFDPDSLRYEFDPHFGQVQTGGNGKKRRKRKAGGNAAAASVPDDRDEEQLEQAALEGVLND